MKRLEQARSKRPLGMLSEDGSGWVPISDTSKTAISDDQISDISPPRRRRLDTPSPEREIEVADLSPPRKQRGPSPEPMIKPSASAGGDLSPPRKHRLVRDASSSLQPEKMSSKRNATDLSPPRRQHKHYPSSSTGLETSVPSDLNNQNTSNISAPYRRRTRFDTPSPRANLEPSYSGREMDGISPRRQEQKRHHSSSPEAKRKPSHSVVRDSDISPPRRVRKDSLPTFVADVSPTRKVGKGRSLSSNLSVPSGSVTSERNASSALDLSPPRKFQKKSHIPKQQPKTGLVTGKDIKEEIARTKKEDWLR